MGGIVGTAEKISSAKRRLWEFKPFIVCRLLGLSFDERDTARILKKLKLIDCHPPPASELHGMLVYACTGPTLVAKYMDRLLEEKFDSYRGKLNGLDQEAICSLIEGKGELKGVPLPALIWLAVRNQRLDIDEIEVRIFNAVHMKEHQALRFYDQLSQILPSGKVEDVIGELRETLRSSEKLENKVERLEQKREELGEKFERIEEEKSHLSLSLTEQRQVNEELKLKLENLGGEPALEQMECMKREIDFLAREVKFLTEELSRKESGMTSPEKSNEPQGFEQIKLEPPCESIEPLSLTGRAIALVGGLESLVPYYRETVESAGGIFYYYCGRCLCSQRVKEIENLVGKADAVFCPIDQNSHNACRCVKKACRLSGRPCRFLRNSGLNAFRRELYDFTQLN
jgi:hypothetical protein